MYKSLCSVPKISSAFDSVSCRLIGDVYDINIFSGQQ
jgi:hypothetical protein